MTPHQERAIREIRSSVFDVHFGSKQYAEFDDFGFCGLLAANLTKDLSRVTCAACLDAIKDGMAARGKR